MQLILNTFGSSLNRDGQTFVVTHKDGKQSIPVDAVESIQLGRGTQITSDAVMLAVEHEIEIIFADKGGMPVGRVWSPRYGSISTIRKGQLEFTFSHDALEWIKHIIQRKMENQQAMLLMLQTDDLNIAARRTKAIARIEDYRTKIASLKGEIVQDVAPNLRGWEGAASRIYFEALNDFIPERYQFAARSQHPALDVVNAMLNYGYGILYGKIEGALIKAGVDPYIGVLHRDDYNRPVLVYDVIEIYRVWVDYVVYGIIVQNIISDDCYSVRGDGSYWLENLGRRILIQSLNDYLEEVITVNKMQRSRISQIQLFCQDLAQEFKRHC